MLRSLRLTAAALVIVGLTATAACSGTPTATSRPGTGAGTATEQRSATSRAGADRQAPDRHVTKLLVFVVENHSLGEMRHQMPWVYRLATRYGYTTRYRAITHPSLPNYLAIAGGSTFGVTDDGSPGAHPLTGKHSVFGRALAAGSTARVYAESMGTPCQTQSRGRYAARHNPWTYFSGERSACTQDDVPLSHLWPDVAAGNLPAVGMVVPNLCNDAHDCGLDRANAWLRSRISRVMRGPDWRSGNLAVVVTADEDDTHHGNRILTVVAHPALHHVVVRTPLSHYALTRAYADVGGFAAPGQGAHARSLLRQLGLVPGA